MLMLMVQGMKLFCRTRDRDLIVYLGTQRPYHQGVRGTKLQEGIMPAVDHIIIPYYVVVVPYY